MVSNPNKNNKMYRRIYNPAKHLRWSVLQKQQKPNDFFVKTLYHHWLHLWNVRETEKYLTKFS